jgi:hypothetical protein
MLRVAELDKDQWTEVDGKDLYEGAVNESMKLKRFDKFRIHEAEQLKGGLADGKSVEDIAKKHGVNSSQIEAQIRKGKKVEMEHTDDESRAIEIAKDHLMEDPKYYDKLKKVEESVSGRPYSGGPDLYIGDGVYAKFDGSGIWLTSEDGASVLDKIYMEPEVVAAFHRFATSKGLKC